MKSLLKFSLGAYLCVQSASLFAQVQTVQEYNKQIPFWGVTWSPGAGAVNGYYPTVYTGFAMRQETPERTHVRLSRGNQTRLTVILDENTIQDYLFDLVKRANVLNAINGKKVNFNPSGAKILPTASWFTQIIDSPVYGIREFVKKANNGGVSREEIYAKSLEVLKALNNHRVFDIKLDLKAEFMKWKQQLKTGTASSANQAIVQIDSLVLGRINYVDAITPDIQSKLNTASDLAINGQDDAQFVAAALDLFKAVTGNKYKVKTLQNGKFVDAIQCSAESCTLTYPEFTAIYPTGSTTGTTSDRFGNRINDFATRGLWNFVSRGARNVDNIRDEPYYGFAPKMDYQSIGNGFHNPAVRFFSPSSAVKASIGAPSSHNTLWAVKRGPVSHGCSRLPIGHLWEMRQIFPVEDSKMVKLQYFGNNPQDFDLFDIDGDGKAEVMGVDYMIKYGMKADSGLQNREGQGFQLDNDRKVDFYTDLYGSRNVFTVNGNGQLIFKDPSISVISRDDLSKSSVKTRVIMNGEFPLYQAEFEREKVQFYSNGGSMNKVLHRIMGRIRGCAPMSDKQACGEAAFDSEARSVLGL